MKKYVFFAYVLLFVSNICIAGDTTIGDWFLSTDSDELMFAISVNDTGSVFGQYCFAELRSCMYLIAFKTRCEQGHKYQILANTDAGAFVYEIVCGGALEGDLRGYYRYVFENYETIDKLVWAATKVGFAIPLEGDAFKVIRFDIRGATSAMEYLGKKAERLLTPASQEKRKQSEEFF